MDALLRRPFPRDRRPRSATARSRSVAGSTGHPGSAPPALLTANRSSLPGGPSPQRRPARRPRRSAWGVPPRPVSKEMQPLNLGQASTLLEAARGEKLEALYVLALTTGMRQGELLGLKWEDVNIESGTLHVRRTLSTAMGEGFSFNPPKTTKSRRRLKVPQLALHALRRHRAAQLAARLKVAGLWKDHDLVFTTGVGTPIARADL